MTDRVCVQIAVQITHTPPSATRQRHKETQGPWPQEVPPMPSQSSKRLITLGQHRSNQFGRKSFRRRMLIDCIAGIDTHTHLEEPADEHPHSNLICLQDVPQHLGFVAPLPPISSKLPCRLQHEQTHSPSVLSAHSGQRSRYQSPEYVLV